MNLLDERWKTFDSHELRLLLDEYIGGPGQYDSEAGSPNKLYLPLARQSCRVALIFKDKKIISIEPGPAFTAAQWEEVSNKISKSLLDGTTKVGREYSFSGFRVRGSWNGTRCGVQILPPHRESPQAPVELAEHPFILEFPVMESDFWPLTNYRRTREHRKLTLLLGVLLRGGTSFHLKQPRHFWADVSQIGSPPQSKWVQEFFIAPLGEPVIERLSPPTAEQMEEIGPEAYYGESGHDGGGLRVPADLDESIWCYFRLSPESRGRFDRALFWMDVADRQWAISFSSSFAALVSAVESLTERGTTHQVYCKECTTNFSHEVPGATERFRAFFENFAPGASLRSRRSQMYALRSGILHGSELMQLDQDVAFGWDPPGWNERELHQELWSLTHMALRSWLKNPPRSGSDGPGTQPSAAGPTGMWSRLSAMICKKLMFLGRRA
ncbi:MAG TPA: hypothetical protein VI685_03455 [Candidatus Angelobacter sp.]